MTVSDYAEGLLFLVPTLGACLAAAAILVRRRVPGLPPVHHALAVFLAFTGLVLFAHVVTGAIGVLSREAVLAVALLVVAAAARLSRADPVERPAPRPVEEPVWLQVSAVVTVAAASAAALSYLLARSSQPVLAVDALATHLPHIVRWMDSGDFWQLVQYAPDLANATYPHNGTVMLLAAVLPWENTFLVRYVDPLFLIATCSALWAVARELGAGTAAAAIAAASVTAMAAVNEPALTQAQVDPPMLAWFAIGALFLLRAARGAATAELVLAGVGLGLAFGTKWYAVAYVPVLVAAYLIARRRDGRALARRFAVLLGTIGGTGGFWLVRNLVETGNPVHPVEVGVGPVTIFDAPPDPLRERFGFTVSDYLTDPDVIADYMLTPWRDNFGVLGPLLLLAAVTGLIVAWRSRARPAFAAAAVGLVMAAVYTRLPDTAFGPEGQPRLVGANARYLVPGLLGGAVVAAWLAGRGARLRAVVALALMAAAAEGMLRSYHGIPLRQAIITVVAVGVAGGAVLLLRRRPAHLALGAVVLALLGGLWLRDRAADATYDRYDEVMAWIWKNRPDGERIGLGKTWNTGGLYPTFPAFGPRMGNDVEYLGRFVDGTLRRWTERGDFQAHVRDRRFDVIVLGTGIPPEPRGEEPEATWARELGYRELERTRRLVLLAR